MDWQEVFSDGTDPPAQTGTREEVGNKKVFEKIREGNLVDKDEDVDGTVCQLLLRQAVVDEDLDCVRPDDGDGDDRGHDDRRAERQLQQNRSLVIHHERDEPEQLGSERRIHFFVRNLKMLRT